MARKYRSYVPGMPEGKHSRRSTRRLRKDRLDKDAVLLVSQGDVLLRTDMWEEAVQNLRDQADRFGVSLMIVPLNRGLKVEVIR